MFPGFREEGNSSEDQKVQLGITTLLHSVLKSGAKTAICKCVAEVVDSNA